MHASYFHKNCDNKGPTLVVIQSTKFDKIFGGFTESKWNNGNSYIADIKKTGFVFSLTHKTKHPLIDGR